MDEPPSEQRTALPPLLTRTNTLTQHSQVTGNDLVFDEYRLIGQPESLKAFCDLFSGKNDDRIIWVTKNAFVFSGGKKRLPTLEDDEVHDFGLSLRDKDEECHYLSINSSTLEEAIICLDYLVGLKDTHFEEMGISYTHHDEEEEDDERRLCPFDAKSLEKMLQNSARRIRFDYMIFTPDHCRTLASSGTRTDIVFYDCEFQDDGAAFVEASAARRDKTSGPAKLCFHSTNPFNDRNWALFLSQHKLEYLYLCYAHLESEISCRAMATAQVRRLKLDYFNLEDEGAALVESVREGRGPKELCLCGDPYDSAQRLVAFMPAFMNALRINTNLELLELNHFEHRHRQVTQALVAALHENKGLVHLKLSFELSTFWDDEMDPTELLKAISKHPSLRSLDLRCPWCDTNVKHYSTKAVADMLSINERVEVMTFHDDTFDKDDWNTNVVPRLECNIYRKHFPLIQKIGEASTRAAVFAIALAKFADKPHLVWMLLKQNHDVVSSYLDMAYDQVSAASRKCSRSPSLDGTSPSN
jgi:hypothetical protein